MQIFKVQMKRTQVYDFAIEAVDEDEALDVANQAIEDVDSYDLEDNGWEAESREADKSETTDKYIEQAVKNGSYISANEFFN